MHRGADEHSCKQHGRARRGWFWGSQRARAMSGIISVHMRLKSAAEGWSRDASKQARSFLDARLLTPAFAFSEAVLFI